MLPRRADPHPAAALLAQALHAGVCRGDRAALAALRVLPLGDLLAALSKLLAAGQVKIQVDATALARARTALATRAVLREFVCAGASAQHTQRLFGMGAKEFRALRARLTACGHLVKSNRVKALPPVAWAPIFAAWERIEGRHPAAQLGKIEAERRNFLALARKFPGHSLATLEHVLTLRDQDADPDADEDGPSVTIMPLGGEPPAFLAGLPLADALAQGPRLAGAAMPPAPQPPKTQKFHRPPAPSATHPWRENAQA